MPNIKIQHKTQTRANDCWYACIQMLRTHREYFKTKPEGEGVSIHRNAKANAIGWELVWGNPLGSDDAQWRNILTSNRLIEVSVLFSDTTWIQDALNTHGPLMVIGDFVKIGPVSTTFGHWVVITGTNISKDTIHINDPAWGILGGGEREVKVGWFKNKVLRGSKAVVNDPAS